MSLRVEREQKERQEKEYALAKEWASKIGWKYEDARLIDGYRCAIRCSNQISTLATKASLTEQEAEAVLAHLDPSIHIKTDALFVKKNTLLALQVLNRFATEHKIRVEDAITVFREYIS
jgi:hypothetical protein